MNEQAQASQICRHLDQATEQLSYRVQERLAASRAAALSKVPEFQPEPAPLRSVPREKSAAEGATPWWLRLAAVAAPLLLMAGIFLVDVVDQEQAAAELGHG